MGDRTGASGPLVITVPDTPGRVTGNLKIGAKPAQALTGFVGTYEGRDGFEASGQNTRGEHLGAEGTVHISVVLRGTKAPDGQTVAGTVFALINGVEQPEWTFAAAAAGAHLPDALGPGDGSLGVFAGQEAALAPIDEQEPGLLSRVWQGTPAILTVAAGVGTAVLGGLYWFKWRK